MYLQTSLWTRFRGDISDRHAYEIISRAENPLSTLYPQRKQEQL